MIDPTYLDALRALAQPIRAAAMPRSLAPMRRLLAELGDPQTRFQSVVVTGSVSKGTTCHQIAQLLYPPLRRMERGRGGAVGLFTSPHLHSFRERLVVSGERISQAEFVEAANAVLEAAARLNFAYSTFELATALVLWWFARRGVNIAVLEVGIGGRWDAVNAVENGLAVFTPIEREHVAMLGGSLQTIAWNKAGIIQANGHALSVPQDSAVEAILRDEAALKQATFSVVAGDQLAHAACNSLMQRSLIPQRSLDADQPLIHLPGRLETITLNGRTVLIDGGHTPASARRLHNEIDRLAGMIKPIRLIVGMLRDKSARDFLAVFDAPHFRITLTTAPVHRALSPDELEAQAKLHTATVEIIPDLNAALAHVYSTPESLVVVAGSLRIAAAAREAFGLLTPDALAEARATRAIFEGDDYRAKLG